MKSFSVASILAYSAAVAQLASAHMALTEPCPRYSPHCNPKPELPAGASFDYSIKNPIPPDGELCKGTVPWPSPVATWKAGQDVTYKFESGGAAHGGGHCQFSLSYDGGKTFVVVHEVLGHCFFSGKSTGNTAQVTEYTFKLPAEVPNSDKVIAAWSWVNAIGNREFYMNCADIKIEGSSSSSYTGKQIVIANHDGYPTIPEFGGNYDTGIEYYQNAKQVTVTGNGSSSGGGSDDAKSSAPATPAEGASAQSTVGATEGSATDSAESNEEGGKEKQQSDAVDPAASAGNEAGSEAGGEAGGEAAGNEAAGNEAADSSQSIQDSMTSVAEEALSSAAQEGNGIGAQEGGECTSGLMQCSGSGYQICVNGKWSPEYACGVGTTCKGTEGHIFCDFASSD
ncbi:hypothetical protein LPJ78_003947 [Coemansia sp. RSA 989]|nr:hypothetical protein BX667DRAFT_497837 [Coemansia mojavensis]KAJ1738254.1 hypothetical protein LPJ68_005700 [Coemansia sp. RSA 1086]KAJ1746505.1 hypothetical protein LPJ79_005838 [Coemansia sp. RSA 1821]KAJ1863560.1 hypothetical protein LPJ78_003947 [Coemansia sp. RSA 989]